MRHVVHHPAGSAEVVLNVHDDEGLDLAAVFYGDVRPRPDEPVVTKHRFSAFHNTDLETILKSHAIRMVVMTGVASNVCVETTARDAFVRDYYVVFLEDGTATYADEEHDAANHTKDSGDGGGFVT